MLIQISATVSEMKTVISTKNELLNIIEANKRQIIALGIKRLGLFGSFVRNEATETSDIDFLVEFQAGQKTFDNYMQLSFLLEELLARPVELVTPESVSPYLRPYIINEVEYVSLVS